MRDLFTAVFFVAVGLQIDVGLLWQHALPILAISLFVVVLRVGATTTSLALVGMPPRDAFRAGLMVAPIGEFSFLFAQLGVVAVLVPAELFPISVGVSLLTSLAASALARRGGDLTNWVAGLQPAWLAAWGEYYRDWIDRIQAQRSRNLLWQLSKKRFVQILVSVLFVTGLLVFAERLHDFCQAWLGRDLWFPDGLRFVFWSSLFLRCWPPWSQSGGTPRPWRFSIRRSLPAVCRARPASPRSSRTELKLLAGGIIVLWLSSLLPTEGTARWLLVWMSLLAAGALYFLRRRLVHWHSELEVELQERMAENEARPESGSTPWLRPYGAWNLSVSDCVLRISRIARVNESTNSRCAVALGARWWALSARDI